MPANIIELYVPCRLIDVTVSIAPAGHLSNLEKLVLRAVHAGVSQFFELVDLFGLGQRPTLDLVSDLWHRGYLALDIEKSELWITDEVRAAIECDKLDRLSTSEVEETKAQVAQELISGHILRTPRRPRLIQGSRVVPVEYSNRPLGSEHRQEVISVLDEVLVPKLAVGRGAKVLAINFGLLGLTEQGPTPQHERRLMELRVQCTRHASTGRLSFQILHPVALPARVRKSMERGLGKITAQLHTHKFARTMRERAETPSLAERPEPAEATRQLAQRCGELTASLPKAHPGLDTHSWVRGVQEALELAALPAREGAEELLLSQHTIEVLPEGSRYTRLINEAMDQAKHQLILCIPKLQYSTLQVLLPRLEAQLNGGLSVFLLWGREPDSELDTQVKNRLAELHRKFPRLYFAQRSARIGSFMIIRDDDLAILSSTDPLVPSPGRALWLGVALRPKLAQQGGALEELITFCRNAFPDHRVASNMESTWTAQTEPEKPALFEFPQLLPAADAAWQSERAPVTLSLWREQWSQYVQQLAGIVSLRTDTAKLVTDDQIREVFWNLVSRKQQRLIVISRRVTNDVVNTKLIQVLTERLTDQTSVTIVFSEVGDPAAVERLENLKEQFPDHMRLLAKLPSLRSECVLSDDRVLLSSLRLLCDSGEYVGSQRYRMPEHTGLILHGDEVLQAILSTIYDYEPQAAADVPKPIHVPSQVAVTAQQAPPMPPAALTLVSKLTSAASDPSKQTAILREWFHEMPAAKMWASLEQLQRAELPELWLAVTCALGVVPSHLNTAEGQEWQARLAAHSWHVLNSPQRTWLLLHDWPALAVPATLAQLPQLPVVALAAVQDQPAIFSLRQRALSDSLSDEEALGIAALSIVSVLRGGNQDAARWLEGKKDRLAPPLAKLASSVLRYFDRAGTAYPRAEVAQQFQVLGAKQAREKTRAELLTALTEARQIKTAFSLMRATWEQLFAPDGPLVRLEQLVSRDGSIVDWWNTHGKTERQLDGWLDEHSRLAATAIGWHGPSHIERGPRMSSLQRLRAIFATTRRLAGLDAAIVAVPRLRDSSSIDLAQELKQLRTPLRDVVDAASRKRTASAPLLRTLKEFLHGLTEAIT